MVTEMKRIITYGTFDMFHTGHYNILKRAKEHGDYLVVGVTAENYDAERGKLSVQDSLSVRIENVRKTGFADLIIVEEYLGQKISDILKYNIDTFVIGSDWRGKFDHLNKYCDVVYLERTKNISSTQLRNETLNIYKMGIVTNNIYDNGAIRESKCVSGIHIESVFSENKNVAEQFAEKYELEKGENDFNAFLDGLDIVYVKVPLKERKKYVIEALKNKKHVICDAPISLKAEEVDEMILLAIKNNVVLINNVAMVYLQSFDQLSWMTRGNVIGDILSIKCNISQGNFDSNDSKSIVDLAFYPVCTVIKLLGNKFNDFNYSVIKKQDNKISYSAVEILYSETRAFIEIGIDLFLEDGIVITGTEGTIVVPDDWWNLGYFKMRKKGEYKFKRYSFNYDGNGFRYVIRSFLNNLRQDQKRDKNGCSIEELKAANKILNEIYGVGE